MFAVPPASPSSIASVLIYSVPLYRPPIAIIKTPLMLDSPRMVFLVKICLKKENVDQ